jgi:hypothetical protein
MVQKSTKTPYIVIMTVHGKKCMFLQFCSGHQPAMLMSLNYKQLLLFLPGPVL